MILEYFIKTFAFIIVHLTVGLGFSLYFRKVIRYKSILELVIYAISLGLLLNTFTILTVGMFGFDVLGLNYFLVVGGLSIISLLLTYRYSKRSEKKDKILLLLPTGSDRFDLAVYLGLFAIFMINYVANGKVFAFQTDEFKFWLIDTRIIFNTNALRQTTDVISLNAYSSFMPIHYAQIYYYFGRVVEQYAAIISSIYLALASFILYFQTAKMKKEVRYLAAALLMLTQLIYIDMVFLAYSDIALSFYVFFSTLIIIRKVEPEHYHWKILFLLLAILATSFIKYPVLQYSPYATLLFLSWIVYDRKLLKDYFRHMSRKKLLRVGVLIIPSLILVANKYYRAYILEPVTSPYFKESVIESGIDAFSQYSDLPKLLTYPKFLFDFLWEHHIELTLFWFLAIFLASFFYISVYKKSGLKHFNKYRDIMLLSFISFSYPLMNISFYALHHRRGQMERYLTTAVLVAVLMIILIARTHLTRRYMYAIIVFLLGLSVICLPKATELHTGLFRNDFHSGSYSESPKFLEAYQISEDVKSEIGDSKLLIGRFFSHCVAREDPCIENMSNNLNSYRYFLEDNHVAELYKLYANEFPQYMIDSGAEYVLVVAGFTFAKEFETEGDMNKFIHLYRFDAEERKFQYIKGYQDFEYQ